MNMIQKYFDEIGSDAPGMYIPFKLDKDPDLKSLADMIGTYFMCNVSIRPVGGASYTVYTVSGCNRYLTIDYKPGLYLCIPNMSKLEKMHELTSKVTNAPKPKQHVALYENLDDPKVATIYVNEI